MSAGTGGNAVLPPGETYLSDTPVLAAHNGTQPDLFLRWNAIPLGTPAVDVVVHLHGFSQQGAAMSLASKVPYSGLDLTGRTRPTLAVLPRGNSIRYSWYDFPALLDGGLDCLIEYALQQFARLGGCSGIDRFILTGHSGGGMPSIDAIASNTREPDELYVFDGLYGRDPALGDPLQGLEVIDAWLGRRFAQEPDRPGAFRSIFVEQQTGPMSREAGKLIDRHIAAADPAPATDLSRRYRVERSHVPHSYVAAICGPQLLENSAIQFDWTRPQQT